MRLKAFKIVLALGAAMLALPWSAGAQQYGPEWGENDSIRMENVTLFSLFRSAYSMKDYNGAADFLQQLMKSAPGARAGLYHAGVNLYKQKYNDTTDDQQKQIFADSINLIYDTWIEYFGEDPKQGRAFLARAKAIDYNNLMGNDRDNVRKYFKEAVEADQQGEYLDMAAAYFQQLTDDYKLFETVGVDEYLAEYEAISSKLDTVDNPEKETVRETIDALAVQSGALGCENLEKIYSPRLAENPDDKELHMKALNLLRRNKCDGPFFMQVAEKAHALDPSSSTALILAAYFEDKKEYKRAIGFLTDALANETDPETKENLYIRMAVNNLGANTPKAAADNAKQAIALNPNSGLGYYTLGQALASGASSCEAGFQQQSVYWLVYDNLAKARQLLKNDDNQIQDIDKQLASYSQNFPSNEETFFRGLEENSPYTVSCGWISGTTTVRSYKK